MPSKVYRSFLTFAAPDELLVRVMETVKKDGLKEARKGNIAKLEIAKKSYRDDIIIGDLYIIPASVCNKPEEFPHALLMSSIVAKFDQDDKVDAKMGMLESSLKVDKNVLKIAKELLFGGKDGFLLAFSPAWGGVSDVKTLLYDEDSLYSDLRDKVFAAMYDPSLSSAFEQIKALSHPYRVEAIPLQQHIFKVPTYGQAYPEIEKGSETEDKELPKTEITSANIGKDAWKSLKIATEFRTIASSLVPKDKKANKIRLTASRLSEVSENFLEPGEIEVFNDLGSDLDTKVSSETGLRNRMDYGEPGSKETVGPELVDGPDPKKADKEENTKVVVEMPKEDFVKEHKKLVDVLEHGSDEEQRQEGEEQGAELKKVEASEEEEGVQREEVCSMDANDWFLHEDGELVKPELTENEKTQDQIYASKKATKTASSKKSSKPKRALTLLVPGQVLDGFYPDVADDLDYNPAGREETHSPGPEELQMNMQKEDDGQSTKGPAGIGLGPSQTEGAPLRKEFNLRGPGFINQFYTVHDDVNPESLVMRSASKKASAEDNQAKLSSLLKLICGQVAAALMTGFQITKKPLFTEVPTEWIVDLHLLEEDSMMLNQGSYILKGQTTGGSGIKFLAESLNDTQLTEALNGAWAQAAVWNEGEDGSGFAYEIFVRAEKLDIDLMQLIVKYVIKSRKDEDIQKLASSKKILAKESSKFAKEDKDLLKSYNIKGSKQASEADKEFKQNVDANKGSDLEKVYKLYKSNQYARAKKHYELLKPELKSLVPDVIASIITGEVVENKEAPAEISEPLPEPAPELESMSKPSQEVTEPVTETPELNKEPEQTPEAEPTVKASLLRKKK